jgi:hypothetical protein
MTKLRCPVCGNIGEADAAEINCLIERLEIRPKLRTAAAYRSITSGLVPKSFLSGGGHDAPRSTEDDDQRLRGECREADRQG